MIDPELLSRLVCPVDRTPLREEGRYLLSAAGRRYPVVEGIPVLLVKGAEQTMELAERSIAEAERIAAGTDGDPYSVDTLGITDAEKAQLREALRDGRNVDPVVSHMVGATNGIAYKHVIGSLEDYPIPAIRLPPGEGRRLLDVGCNWGRWCIAAARAGYVPTGLDPQLGAVRAAARLAKQLKVNASFVVGDARRLPFRDGSFDVGYSYSVLQHFSRPDAAQAVTELGRVLVSGGTALVQMAAALGLRSLQHQLRRSFREPNAFDVRYYSVPALKRLFTERIGPTRVAVDCFFGLGLQPSDLRFMRPAVRAAVRTSEVMRGISRVFPPLKYVADSVFVTSVKPS